MTADADRSPDLDLLVLGNLIVDDVVHADGTTRMGQAGGAVLYVALAARLFGLKVGIVSLAGSDYPSSMLRALAARGIETAGIARTGEPGLRLWLLDEGQKRQVVHRLQGPSHVEASPTAAQIPRRWRGARAVHLAPMPFAVQSSLVEDLSGHCYLSLDPFELLRDPELRAWREILAKLDTFFLSDDEMMLSGDPEHRVSELAQSCLGQGTLVFKRAARGGVLWHQGQRTEWPGHTADVVDATGAGDAFAAGFLAGRLKGEPVAVCASYGAVAAGLVIEGVGPAALLDAEPALVASRLRRSAPGAP